ncbi:porin family protein [Kordia sp.]|uniref:porin family protein n=1 Tax=Kordia sp. TaxID=1965332 RepID=UPI003D2C82AC
MKKQLLITLFCFVCICITNAQEITKPVGKQTTFGFKVGLSGNHFGNQFNDSFTGVEFYAGLFLETSLSENFSIQNELLFSTFTDSYDFIEVPILLKYKISDKFSLFAGPKLDFLINESNDLFQFKPLGISAEIGVQYNISKRFFLEGRYSHSFTKQVNVRSGSSEALRTLRFGVGFRF